MKKRSIFGVTVAFTVALALLGAGWQADVSAAAPTYDTTTLAGKVASVNGTAGLQIRFSAFIEQEADMDPFDVIAPDGVMLAGTDPGVVAPDVTVNQDTAGAPQNETAIAVDPHNPNRVVGAANDYVTRTWSCTVGGKPCSALGDGYSGTYYSNDGGATWCCNSSDPQHLGTLIPGVDRLAGGVYDAGGDPALAFDSRGNVYYAGLGFDRTAPPSTVAVNRGTFDASGALTWSAPTFINPTTSPATLNDKEWIAADANPASRFRDRVYVTWTRFIFNPHNGRYVQSPIFFAYSADGGRTFSTPQSIVSNVLYGQGSRPIVGPDGTLYVFWDGATRLATYDSTWMVKSSDGGATWSKPVAVAPLIDIAPPANTAFRVNSYPAAAIAPDGTLYATWSTELKNDATGYSLDPTCAGANAAATCHAAVAYSRSTDGGATWSAPTLAFDAANRTAVAYPVTQPDGTTLNAPAARPVDTFFPAIAAGPDGTVYLSAYAADVVAPWQSCAKYDPSASVNCLTPGPYIDNAKLDYVVKNLGTGAVTTATQKPINTRYQFRGAFIGDYTDLAVGSDGTYHAFWTDSNNQQAIDWFYGVNLGGLLANEQDVVTYAGR